jgi:hypothetical protein
VINKRKYRLEIHMLSDHPSALIVTSKGRAFCNLCRIILSPVVPQPHGNRSRVSDKWGLCFSPRKSSLFCKTLPSHYWTSRVSPPSRSHWTIQQDWSDRFFSWAAAIACCPFRKVFCLCNRFDNSSVFFRCLHPSFHHSTVALSSGIQGSCLIIENLSRKPRRLN